MLAGGLFALSGARASEAADPASVVGLWQSVSDVDGKPKSHIRIREVNGRLEGTVEYIINPARREAVCDLCRDDRKNQRVLGMTILRDAHRDGESWVEGNILDPENGKVYSCRLTLIDGGRRLNLRGYIGIPLIGRTQTWVRLETP